MNSLPRLKLTEDPNNNNEFIIFHQQIKGNNVPSLFKKTKLSSKKRGNHKKHKTIKRKHNKNKSVFNIFRYD